MNPDDFQDGAPGRLVQTEFDWVEYPGGRATTRRERGWAFIPNPPPGMEQLGHACLRCLALNERAVAALGRLDGFFRQTPGGFNVDQWVLLSPLRLREARLSSKIENTVATGAEVGLAAAGATERIEPLEVRNYLRTVEAASGIPSTANEAAIRSMHADLLEGIPDAARKPPGQYRDKQVFIGDERAGFANARFVPPPPGEVPGLMHDLVEFMRSPSTGLPKLFASAVAHYQFETIHPFADGNGRLGRMLITLSLTDDELLSKPLIYPSGYIDQHKQGYYDALLGISTHADWGSWFEYFLSAVCAEAEGTLARLQRLAELRAQFIERTSDKTLGPRFTKAIDCIFESPTFTVRSLHQGIGGSEQTARNYVELLLEREIVIAVTKIGKQALYQCPAIYIVSDED